MSQQPSVELRNLRDMDELEGTLLLPRAQAVQGSDAAAIAATAVPVESFVYEQNTTGAASATTAVVVSENDEKEIEYAPEAPTLPLYNDDMTREQKERAAMAKAKQRARQVAEAENDAIRKGLRESKANEYHTARQVQEANERAKIRNAQGVQIEEDKWFGREKPQEPKEKPNPSFSNKYGGGYEVAKYEVSNYATKDDYQVSEYRSIYDQVA